MQDLKLTIDLLPRGAWGHDLSKTLPKRDWDTLRNFCYEKANHQCEICGVSDGQLHAHEVWEFDVLNKTQTLTDIIAICSACHGVKHFRNSQRIGYGVHAKSHFMKVNKCDGLVFAGHQMEAENLFEERSKVLRWKIVADLGRFGGKKIKYAQKTIPYISNPYDAVDWLTVNHIKSDEHVYGNRLKDFGFDASNVIDLLTYDEVHDVKSTERAENVPKYFIETKTMVNENDKESAVCLLPPLIRSITVDNFEGSIMVVCDYTNKIQWFADQVKVKTRFNVAGRFATKFYVENLTSKEVRFFLIGDGGNVCSLEFALSKM